MFPMCNMYEQSFFQPVWYFSIQRPNLHNQKIEEKSPQLPAEPEKQHQEFKQQIIKALEGSNIYSKKKHWEKEEDGLLRNLHQKENMNWKQISQQIPDTNQRICQRRYRRILENQKNWLPQEEEKIKYLRQVENKKWKQISQAVPNHSSKQIRERYINFLRSDIINKGWQLEEDLKIISSLCENGKKWKRLEKQLEGRSENQIKNRYYGTLIFIEKRVKKKMRKEKNKKNRVSTKEQFS